MFDSISEIKSDIKQVVDPRVLQQQVRSSWQDFWYFEIAKADGEPVTLGIVIIAVVCFVLGVIIAKWLSSRITKLIFQKFNIHPNTLHVWSTITFYLMSIFVTILALKIAHVPLTIFTLLGGAIALGVGFGSKNIVNNFMSGVFFMFEAPAKVGDFVEVQGIFGRVVYTGIRASQLEVGMNKVVIIPNSAFLENPILNWGRAGTPLNLKVEIGVAYESDLKLVEKLMKEAAHSTGLIVESMPLAFSIKSFDASSILVELSFPTRLNVPSDREGVPALLRSKIFELFTKENIVIPYPQLVLRKEAELRSKNLQPSGQA